MNLKKTLFSLFAATAMTLSVATPILAAGETSKATVNEGGSVTSPEMWYSGVSFPAVSVTTSQGAVVNKDNQYVELEETRAYSPGWTITMEAKDLSDGAGHVIPASNLSLAHSHYGRYWNTGCATNSSVSTNPYQTLSGNGGQFGSGAITVLSATAGRGCGLIQSLYDFTLNVPAGTYTGSNTASYTGDLTLTLTDATP